MVRLVLLMLIVNIQGADPVDFMIPLVVIMSYVVQVKKAEVNKIGTSVFYFFSIFILTYAISMFVNDFSVSYVANIILNMMLFLIVFRYATSDRRVMSIMLWLSIGATLFAILSLLSFSFDIKVLPNQFEIIRDGRFLGMLGDPNILAAYSVFLLLYWIDDVIHPMRHYKGARRLLGILFIFVFSFQILSTGSRSAWAGAVIGVIIYLFFTVRKSRLRFKLRVAGFLFIFSTIIVISMMIVSGKGTLERFDSAVNISNVEEDRINLVYTVSALKVAIDNPFGVGPGMTNFATGHVNIDGGVIGSHNVFVQIFSDNGWITGAIFFLAIVILWLKSLINASQRKRYLGVNQSVMLGTISSLLVIGMFHDLIQWKVLWVIMALYVAMIQSKHKFRKF
ncbi:O-antigen ligase family protein [Candidatus Thioglobus sp.]|nr:O-antigen ligase family protein [Candidatus Thioglobus sp.]